MSATTPLFINTNEHGPVHDVLGMKHFYQATASQTGGAFTSFEAQIPSGCGAPLHRHERDAEFFYVLSGELTFISDSGRRVCGAGESVYLPAGSNHGFYNAMNEVARALVIASPGIEAERFFGAIDRAQREQSIDVYHVTEIASRHGIAIVSP